MLTLTVQVTFFLLTPTREVVNGSRTSFAWPEDAARLEAIIPSVHAHATPASRIFVGARDLSRPGGGETVLYHLMPEYEPSTCYLEIASGAADQPGSR